MRVIVIGAVLVFGVLLETTMVSRIAVFGVTPNLMLSIIVSYSILRGDTEGAIAGFAGGLLKDVALGQSVGLFAMLGLLVGHFCGKPFRDFYRESFFLPMLSTGVMTVAYGLALYMFYTLTIARVNILYYIGGVVLPVAVYTMVVSVFIYRILYGINHLIEMFEKRRHKVFNR